MAASERKVNHVSMLWMWLYTPLKCFLASFSSENNNKKKSSHIYDSCSLYNGMVERKLGKMSGHIIMIICIHIPESVPLKAAKSFQNGHQLPRSFKENPIRWNRHFQFESGLNLKWDEQRVEKHERRWTSKLIDWSRQ